MNLEDAKNNCTVSSIWVCMIEDKFLVAKGHTAWRRKSDVVNAFKNSEYWKQVVDNLMTDNPNSTDVWYKQHRCWKYGSNGKELEATAYQKLLDDGTVKYYEIAPTPGWV
jgi:hypothetical protein